MKIWFVPALLALYWLPQLASDRDSWDASEYDIYLFESTDKKAMAVVTPDPFFADEEIGVRAWRAEVHVRVGELSLTEELHFWAESIDEGTLLFVETAWGREVHVFEEYPDQALGERQRRRWLARPDGLVALHP